MNLQYLSPKADMLNDSSTAVYTAYLDYLRRSQCTPGAVMWLHLGRNPLSTTAVIKYKRENVFPAKAMTPSDYSLKKQKDRAATPLLEEILYEPLIKIWTEETKDQ